MTCVPARRSQIERFVDLTVYAPIGLLTVVGERVPGVVAERTRRARQRLTAVRTIGRLAAQQLRAQIDARVAPPADLGDRRGASAARDAGGVTATVPDRRRVPGADATTDVAGSAPAASTLPLDDYESLAASQVVDRLSGLSADELDAVEAFERAHRRRRTVLGKIVQLRTA